MASADLVNIWDEPADQVTPSKRAVPIDIDDADDADAPSSSRLHKRPALFLPSDESDDEAAAPPARPDIDALFDNADEPDAMEAFQDLAPALDLAALRREADARNARAARAEFEKQVPAAATQPSGSDGRKKKGKGKGGDALGDGDASGEEEDKPKKRKPLPRLDEARLLGKDGFPQLVKDTKYWKPKGKGYEALDLDRVLQTYQFWAHKMYPKMKFKDTVERVEKLCHSRRMHVALSVWRDQEKGLINGIDPSLLEPDEKDGNSESEVIDLTDGAAAKKSSPQSSRNSSPAPSRAGPRVIEIDDEDDLFSSSARRASLPPATPSPGPSTTPSDDFDMDMLDMDALLEEEAAMRAAAAPAVPAPTHAYKSNVPEDDDEDQAMWDALDMEAAAAPKPMPREPARVADEDEDDLWDLMREAEQQQSSAAAVKSAASVQKPPTPTNDEGWDDMYL
ncbi:Swi3-domain-containing protein [Auriscalpium vulgare]|uniref:Swi3-domain-containing protein n=1 Tax=Auriscalpium vulgare TaxID=40419 RepID=A0ACB8SDS6_9AGAM|nr:Swi3-domain-containing protein [Auriscalpium vulgare]